MTWAAIEGYEGVYAVSDEGDVMSMNYAKSRLPGLMTQIIRRGYSCVFFRKRGEKGRWFTVHSLVAQSFIGPRPTGLQINHIDGQKLNNRRANLEYMTPSENTKHSFQLGLQCNKGEQHSQSKLTECQVLDIRQRIGSGDRQTAIAKELGLSQSCISRVNSGSRWPHLPTHRKAG